MTSQVLAAAAAVGLLGAGFAGATETRSFSAMTGQTAMFGVGEGGGADNKCRVDVVRSGEPGSADITRQDFNDGSCVCIITTGPAGNNGGAEATVNDLLRDRECTGAPVAAVAGAGASAGSSSGAAAGAAAAGAGGAGAGTIVGVMFGVAALGAGVAAGGGGGGNDSAG